jgi:hypothetical protein
MTMHRRPLGQGRTLAALGGVLIVVGSILPWWQVGGDPGLPAVSGNGLEGVGIVVFLVGVMTLALVALPYAVGDRPTSVDRALAYGILAVVGWGAFAWRSIELLVAGAFQFTEPTDVLTHGPGLWVCGIGLAILSRAVYRMTREPVYR